jgi:phosphinothricin acetyltransferase
MAHLPAIRDIYNHAIRTTAATFDLEERTMDDRAAWLKDRGPAHPVLVAVDDGDAVLGWASLSPYDKVRAAYARTVEDSIYVRPEAHGRHVGSLLLGALMEAAHTAGHHAIIARITGGNAASVRLHERFGFATVGTLREVGRKFGQWHDVLLMQAVI